MNKNYLKIAFRNLVKQKLHSLNSIFGIAILVSLFTVSFQAIKAARANPVEALRYE